jgi:hypothetical protein
MPLWDNVKTNVVEWYSVAADKTEEMARIGIRRYDRFGIGRDIERQYAELGNYVYNAYGEGKTGFTEEATFQAVVKRIKELESELQRKEKEIERIRGEVNDRKAAATAAGAATVQEAPAQEAPVPETPRDEAEKEATEPAGDSTEHLIKDPQISPGSADSAILLDGESPERPLATPTTREPVVEPMASPSADESSTPDADADEEDHDHVTRD